MTHDSKAYRTKYKPTVLKQLMQECGITQADLARMAGCKRPTMNLVVNKREYQTPTFPHLRKDVERFIISTPAAAAWLREHEYTTADIWQPLGKKIYRQKPVGFGQVVGATRRNKPMVPGDPEEFKLTQEVEMLTADAMKQFKIFRSPFFNDIDPIKDTYLSEDHRYIHMAMLEAARHCGFLAVIGEVGSGKTMMRRLFVQELRQDESIRIIYPRIVDKTRITASSICDAIIYDLAGREAKPKLKLEQKSRQVEDLMLARSKSGIKMVMLIEEAQDLTACPRVLKLFKRFHEIEDGVKKILGIVLVGQPELDDLLNEGDHYDMREVIRRIQVARITGLNGSIKDYLVHKFKRINVTLSGIIDDKAIEALSKRLTTKEGGRNISVAYPLTVNIYIIRCMNWAALHGYKTVTEEVVNAI